MRHKCTRYWSVVSLQLYRMVGSTKVDEQCEVSKCDASEHDIGVLSVFSYTGCLQLYRMVGSTKVDEQCEVSKCDASEHDIGEL
ncbi:hypothetical protein J6590_103849 [Homalodisca vitripennis]|nr:hypothetical protein J6590_103849 [Homalodisca vitripennis]